MTFSLEISFTKNYFYLNHACHYELNSEKNQPSSGVDLMNFQTLVHLFDFFPDVLSESIWSKKTVMASDMRISESSPECK